MKVSFNWLKEYIDLKNTNPKKLAELLTMHSFEVESIEKSGKDFVLDIAILPNRAHDCLSHIGIAKEIAALLKLKTKNEKVKIKEDKKLKIADYISVDVKRKDICPRYTARVILNVKVCPSQKWLRERLEAIGQKSINNVVDATNYVMFEMGQPLHAFDFDKIKGGITIDFSKKDEIIETLGGEKYVLDSDILTIRSKDGALAIAGIKGGTKAEIDKNTKNIVLESAYFNPVSVRRTSKKLNLRTDSSLRFENGVSPVLCREAIDRVVDIISQISGGTVVSGVIDTAEKKYPQTEIVFSTTDIKNIIGIDILDKNILDILKRLGFFVKSAAKKEEFIAVVPYNRLDVILKEDLAEEVARIYGYENIKSRAISAELLPEKRNEDYFYSELARDIMIGLGFFDVYNYSFIGEKETEVFENRYPDIVKLQNPISKDRKYLRPSLLFHLLNNIFNNLKHQKRVRAFEIGKVFSFVESKKIKENKMIAGVVAYKTSARKGAEEFYELKGVVETFFTRLGISDIWFDDYKPELGYSDPAFWHSGRAADIKVKDKKIGSFGEISPNILSKIGIDTRVAAFEIDFTSLLNLINEIVAFRPISKFPAVMRDIAVLVNPETRVIDVQEVIESTAGALSSCDDCSALSVRGLLLDIDLFDLYESDTLGEDLSKSFAFHLMFQSQERTLSDGEIDKIMEKIISVIEEIGWEIRR